MNRKLEKKNKKLVKIMKKLLSPIEGLIEASADEPKTRYYINYQRFLINNQLIKILNRIKIMADDL